MTKNQLPPQGSEIKVAIIMGSDSDLPVMAPAAHVLDDLSIGYHLTIVSAHRTPDRMYTFAKSARDQGFSVIIAGAGGAAHLPGMVAALTDLPVIGVPVKTSSLQGLDSLLSIVQMPAGVPVATVAINGAKNAGLLAAKIIAVGDPQLFEKLQAYRSTMEHEVQTKIHRLEQMGIEDYLKNT
jgi:5-(carboxyamino)imidazole ribonucleotide mutase